jgi:phage pi2 protein 07
MLFSNDRTQLRQFFFDTWQKYQAQVKLSDIEIQLLNIILAHPEYQAMLEQPEKYLAYDYLPQVGESNPFLHLALHMSILEQITTDRPIGITKLYQRLLQKLTDTHETEHAIIECLAQGLWRMQRGQQYTEADYLYDLEQLLQG